MTVEKLKQAGWLILASFVVGAGLSLLDSNTKNIFVEDVATWQAIATGGVFAAVTMAVLYFTPITKQFGLDKN